MPTVEGLKALPGESLWEFLKWLAYSQGRYVGIRTQPPPPTEDDRLRVRLLVGDLCRAVKQPDDETLGIRFPSVEDIDEDAGIVALVAEYVAARQVALYRTAADFESHHATKIQEDALKRIQRRFGS